ncbi:hypothetical protein B5M09_012767, partial [Aphanomyces astaci]
HALPNSKKRWTSHLNHCAAAPHVVNTPQPKKHASLAAFVQVNRPLEADEAALSPRHERIGAWIDRNSLGEKFTLDKAYADIFYLTGIPFRFAYSPALETFIKLARPAYAPPTTKAIAGPLLNHAHQDMMAKMNQLVQDQTRISLVSDGWTSLRNEHMVNFVAVFPNKSVKPVFVSAISTVETSQTSRTTWKTPCWPLGSTKSPDVCKLEPYATILESARHVTSFVKDRNALTKRFERIQQHIHVDGELST